MGFFQSINKFLGLESHASPENNDVSSELAHINQEMYKKGAELTERNKMLSLLRKIDEAVLGSITKQEEIAQQVSSLLVTEVDFQIASIFLYDKIKNNLKRLALSQASKENGTTSYDHYITEVSLAQAENIVIQSFTEKAVRLSYSLLDSLLPKELGADEANSLQEVNGVRCTFVYPLVVRNEAIGALVIGVKDTEQNLPEYQKDLLGRLAQVIGIAMDNALLYNEVQDANERLKVLDKLKNEFVSVASHELRTPMTAIKSYLWMALDGKGGDLNEKQKFYVERAYNSVDRLIKMVNDMLNISRIESGKLTIAIKSIDLQKLIQEVIEEVQPRASELGVHISMKREDSLPEVLADADKIKEVVFNLIGNSMKFTPKDGNIVVTFNRIGDMIETKVKDSGVGLESDDLPKLFQKFGLLPGSYITNQAAQGTGLGLYICKSIIELHEGKISVASEGRNKGAEFIFTLKVFNEAELERLSAKFPNNPEKPGELVHSHL